MSSEARTLTANNADELAAWCGGRAVVEHDALDHEKTSPGINVPVGLFSEVKRASVGDTILREMNGSFKVVRNGPK
jgi:hypothetical protein